MVRFVFSFSVAAAMIVLGFAKQFLEAEVARKDEVEATLAFELTGGAAPGRVETHEEALRVTYASLPKNEYGNLGHQAVRYVLHRFFVQRNGWYVKGLEPTNDTWHTDSSSEGLVGSVPSFVQSRLEEQLGERGVNLHELAALAVVIEDLVRNEAVKQIQDVYQVLGFSTEGNMSTSAAQEAIDTYFMIYLAARKVSLSSSAEAARKRQKFADKYKGFSDVNTWMHKVEQQHFDANRTAERGFSFSEVSRIVEEIGEQFGTFNDVECKELKTTLVGMEGRKAGRVRLPDFYNRSLYSHWQFTEKAEYLRVLGALDDSDPAQPFVIVPNYLAARPNCLEATSLYAVCCRNECEDLLGNLEREIGASTATPEVIGALVANMKSDTVTAPRILPNTLLLRLQEVATVGQVNIHGRMFAQWMHHAFPRECPYPHEAGTTAPQTADEWMKASGHQSEQASKEEMKKIVEDACRADEQAGSDVAAEKTPEQDALPWSHKEELLHSSPVTKPKKTGRFILKFFFLACLALALAVLWLQVTTTKKMSMQQTQNLGMFLLVCWSTFMLVITGLLDMFAFVCPVIGGVLLFGGHQVSSMPTAAKKSEKCFV